MSDKRMIIRNCPCFVEGIAIKGNEQKTQTCNNHKVRELTLCQDCTDCKLKQIVELCKEQKVINCVIDGKEQVLKAYYHTHLGDKILELLDMQEILE